MHARPALLLLLLISMALPANTGAPYFHGSAANTFYASQDTGLHLRARQSLLLNAGHSGWVMNGNLGGLLDFNRNFQNTLPASDYLHVYSLYAGSRELLDRRLTLLFGRQFLSPGLSVGNLDGLYAAYACNRTFSASGYAGVDAVYDRTPTIYRPGDGVTAGATLEAKNMNRTDAQLFFMQKFRNDNPFWQVGGLNLRDHSFEAMTLASQLQFDFLRERFHKINITARREILPSLTLGAGFTQSYPQIYSNAYFSFFRISSHQAIRADADWNFFRTFRLHGQYRFLNFEDGQAHQASATVGNDNGGVGLLFETGYAGGQISLTADYSQDLGDRWTLSANIDYTKYRTEEQLSFENSLANAFRAACRLGKGWQAELEGQWWVNPLKEYDARVLNKIRYRW
ncbi:MAG: hypothetical protein V1913_01215 [Fibrobacterota bacterium]